MSNLNALQLYRAAQTHWANRSNAVVVDVDGTLCDARGEPIAQGVQFAQCHHRAGNRVLIVTAREERWRHHTLDWLHKHHVHHHGLWMRRTGDRRPDHLVKADIFHQLTRHYLIHAAIDDHPDVLDTWKRLGIPHVVAA